MPTPRREIRTIAAALFLASLSAACALPLLPSFLGNTVGEVTGRVVQAANGVSVVQLHADRSRHRYANRAPVDPIVIRDGRLQQQIAVVRPDEPVRVENQDQIFHEIFSIGRENLFTVRLSSGEASPPIALGVPGLVRAYCRLHPEESFAILVTAADHLVRLEGSSAFRIPSVPVGEYRIEATGLDGASELKSLRVRAGQVVDLTLRLDQGGDS